MAEPLDTVVSIETPEHIVFQHRVAGPARRAMAHLVDLVLCYTAVIVLAIIVVIAFVGASSLSEAFGDTMKVGLGLILIVLFIAQWVWFAAWEGLRGSTPGKKAFGLRVVTVTGRPIGMGQSMLRNVLRAADLLPTAYLVGVASMALSKRFQRIGDLVAGTLVVHVERAKVASPNVLWPPPQPWEVAALPSDVSLDADERAAIELFLRRRGALGHAREHELANMIAAPLAHRLGWNGPVLDPVRTLALLYDRAANTGRGDAPVSSRSAPAR
ncbi:MAG: RDD family protein [Polyangiales bacterium]